MKSMPTHIKEKENTGNFIIFQIIQVKFWGKT